MPEDDDEKASRASANSLRSKSSKISVVSKASASIAAMKRGATNVFKFSPGSRGSVTSAATTDSVRQMVDFAEGDEAEVLSIVTVRAEEGMDSPIVAELAVGMLLTVLAVGQGRRVKVKVSGEEATVGWISTKTKLNEPLVMKRGLEIGSAIDFEKGGVHEIKAMVTCRAEEKLESEILQELQPGTRVKIEEIGKYNNRRVKISRDGQELGWISTCTRHGEMLIGVVSEGGRPADGRSGMFGASSTKIKTLLQAARSNDLEELKKIVEGGSGVMSKFSSRPNLNSSDIRGKTCLIYACAFGHKEIVLYLLTKTKEVDINAVDDTMKSALHHACKRAKSSDSDTVNIDIVGALIEADANKEARDHNGCTPLMFAVANGDQRVVQSLITAQASLNVKDYEGHTCLDYANNFGHAELFNLLKASGAQSGLPEDEKEEEAVEERAVAEEEEAAAPQGAEADKAPKDDGSSELKKKVMKKKKTAEEGAPAAEGEEKPKKKTTKKKVGEKEREEKKKIKKRMSGVGLGMAEALAVEPEDPKGEVTVEVVTEESNAQQRALKKVEVLLKDPKVTAAELKGALEVAKGANVPASELAKAEAKHQELAEKALALQQLRVAIQDRSVAMLWETLKKAEALNLSKKDIDQAKQVLKEEEPKEEAKKKLIEAASSGDVKILKKAIKDATKAGVSASDLAEYEELLKGSENKEAAAKVLKGALESMDIPALKIAISQAREAGVDAAAVEQAEETLAVEGPKAEARDALEEAVEGGDVARIEEAIERGRRAGLDASEITRAEDVVKTEGEKVKLLAKVREVMEETMSCDMKDVDSVRAAKEKLNEAVMAALAIGVKEDKIYDAEVRRKKLHNTVEDLKGSIRVFCRIRPLSKKETTAGDTNVTKQINVQTVEVGGHQFSFDSVWTPGTQEEVFEDCKDLVQSAVDGYNVTMFAYGQTGAGKTFTMGGVPGNLGVSPRTIAHIFKILKDNEGRFQFTVMGSMLELYRSDLVDLLSKGDPKSEKKKLNVRTEKNGAVTIENLSEETCSNAQELEDLLERGNKARTVAATAMNSESSRSHLVLIIRIISVNKETKQQLRGKLLICDLAGSERLSKSQVTGDGQKEAIEINKSLTSLGDVIEGLTKGSKVIPYRNHKLTQLMQDSLGGTAKTLMFINCSPANSNQDETIMALKYAQRAKTITNKR